MALKANILKAELTVSNMDVHYYDTVNLTLAQHPSETDERLMIRLLAYAMLSSNEGEPLAFTKGLSADDEPELWKKHLDGRVQLWVELGLPSDDRLRKACGLAEQVVLVVYGTDHSVSPWWAKIEDALSRFSNLQVLRIPHDGSTALTPLISNSMAVQCMIQDGDIQLVCDDVAVSITPEVLRN
ncbi:MAG: YaeQ family protein [Pseudomonadota bacterium]